MNKIHDRGGWPNETPIDLTEHQIMDWEQRVDALHSVLSSKGLRTTDEMRRAIESLDEESYVAMGYYERWTAALEMLLVEKGVLTTEEIDTETKNTTGAVNG